MLFTCVAHGATVIALDRDGSVFGLPSYQRLQSQYPDRLKVACCRFSHLPAALQYLGLAATSSIDGLLLDLGMVRLVE
jgi:16S rRNA C1402 N4-methylase RsmH